MDDNPRRADVRLTYATGVVLEALAGGHRYGFDIMDASGLPDGTVYPALRRLERGGLVTSDWEVASAAHAAGRPPRRYYRLTAAGRRQLAVERNTWRRASAAVDCILAWAPEPA